MRLHSAAALVAALLSRGGVWAAELLPIRYDDCGHPGRQPHVAVGSNWTFEESRVRAPLADRTVAFDGEAVVLRYDGLAPQGRYAVRVSYCTEVGNPRVQTLYAGTIQVHGNLELPPGETRTFQYPLPAGAVSGGTLELRFARVSGPNAVVSQVWLLSDVPQPEVSLEVASDEQGRLAVSVLDGLLRPRAQATVSLAGPGGLSLTATTDDAGRAAFDLAGKLPGNGDAQLSLTARAEGVTAVRTLSADAVLFRRPVLTPIPEAIAGLSQVNADLSGSWRFDPTPPGDWFKPTASDAAWPRIQVPGEWVMQGFSVRAGTAAAYRRWFTVPLEWAGCEAKLRFDAVFSACSVWVNGVQVGSHEGGFTPFEVDITRAVRVGARNLLAVAVTSEGLADTLASASGYARHALGGISRKVTLSAVRPAHLVRFHAITDLDAAYRDAVLTVLAEGTALPEGARLRFALCDPSGRPVRLPLTGGRFRPGARGAPGGRLCRLRVKVPAPRLWDAEHPNLYELTAELVARGQVLERVSRCIGFRKVEVRGAQLLLNGRPLKLHGTCRHEVDPARGRSLTPQMWARDVELLKGANVNYVRTSHYPPAEEFLDLCDRAGIYVQDEAPFCWVGGGHANAPEALGLILRSTAEMLERDRSHPCVIIWDLANESAWGGNFQKSHDYVRREDPTRPTLFSGAGDAGVCEIASWHYPGPGGPQSLAEATRPTTCDEYCHLNCYNSAEVSLDPGLRDYWGHALQPFWEEMQRSDNCLGGSLWCWADDLFDVPGVGRVGYGEWGVVDGWRRPKPEWWHVKKIYSPVHIAARSLMPAAPGQPLRVPVDNRYTFTNLRELACEWALGAQRGTLHADVPPGASGFLDIPAAPRPGQALTLRFRDARGSVVDEYCLPVGQAAPAPAPAAPAQAQPTLRQTAEVIEVLGQGFAASLARAGGDLQLCRCEARGTRCAPLVVSGPAVSATRRGAADELFSDGPAIPCARSAGEQAGDEGVLRWEKDAPFGHLQYTARVSGGGDLALTWELRYSGPEVAPREIGLLWKLAPGLQRLTWERDGQWGSYPADHIGRLVGEAWALPGPQAMRPRPEAWALDLDPRGTNDFRSSKYGVRRAALTDGAGAGVEVLPGPGRHIRATLVRGGGARAPLAVALRVDEYADGGGEGFLSAHYAAERRGLKPGDRVAGSCRMRLLPGK